MGDVASFVALRCPIAGGQAIHLISWGMRTDHRWDAGRRRAYEGTRVRKYQNAREGGSPTPFGWRIGGDADARPSLGSGFDNLLFETAISRQLSAVRHSMAERLIVECGVRNVECGILQIRLWGQALIICYRHGRAEVQGLFHCGTPRGYPIGECGMDERFKVQGPYPMRNAEFGMRNPPNAEC